MSKPVTIRAATIADAPAIAYAHLKSWQTAYRGIFSDAYLDGIMGGVEGRTQRWREGLAKPDPADAVTFIAETPDDGIIGFSGAGSEREGLAGFPGEIYTIYLLAEFRGKGIGRELFHHALKHLEHLRHQRFMCWVIDSNPSCAFYARMGGEVVQAIHKEAVIAGTSVHEIAYGWELQEALAVYSKTRDK